jgi:hypothetical protein
VLAGLVCQLIPEIRDLCQGRFSLRLQTSVPAVVCDGKIDGVHPRHNRVDLGLQDCGSLFADGEKGEVRLGGGVSVHPLLNGRLCYRPPTNTVQDGGYEKLLSLVGFFFRLREYRWMDGAVQEQ